MAGHLTITQVKSGIGAQQHQRRTLRALGLRRLHQSVTHPDRPEIRGMIARVAHLVDVTPATGGQPEVEAERAPSVAATPPAEQERQA